MLRDAIRYCFNSVLAIMVVILFSLIFGSCTTTKYVPVEKVVTEYKTKIDTVEKTDTFIAERETIIREADSATIAKLGLQLRDNERAILILKKEIEKHKSNESEYKEITDTVTQYVQVPYPVEKSLSKWEKLKMDFGGIAIGGCIAIVLLLTIKILFKFIKNKP